MKKDRWSSPYITEVVNEGYINGYKDGSFKPSKNITRAEAVTIINNYLVKNGKVVDNYSSNPFSDVPNNTWYTQAVNNVSSLGIVGGDEYGKFNPNKTLSRAEMVVMINNMEDYPKKADYSFWDVSDNAWYAEDVKTAYSNGIVSGVSSIRFNAMGNVTREQFTTIVYNVLNYDSSYVAPEIPLLVDMEGDEEINEEDLKDFEKLNEINNRLRALGYNTSIEESDSELYEFGIPYHIIVSGYTNIEVYGMFGIYDCKITIGNQGHKITDTEYQEVAKIFQIVSNGGSILEWEETIKSGYAESHEEFYDKQQGPEDLIFYNGYFIDAYDNYFELWPMAF